MPEQQWLVKTLSGWFDWCQILATFCDTILSGFSEKWFCNHVKLCCHSVTHFCNFSMFSFATRVLKGAGLVFAKLLVGLLFRQNYRVLLFTKALAYFASVTRGQGWNMPESKRLKFAKALAYFARAAVA